MYMYACICSEQTELRSSAFESYKKPSSRSASQTDLNDSNDQLPPSVLWHIFDISFALDCF